MPRSTIAPSTPAGTSPVIRSHAQSSFLPHAVPGRSGVNADASNWLNAIGSADLTISADRGATVV